MATNTPQNPLELKDVILTRLGAPIVNVEVSQDQIMECISRAIELFIEWHSDGNNKSFAMVTVDQSILDTGNVTFDYPVYAVESMLRVGRDYFSMGGGTTMAWFSDFVNGMANSGSGNQGMATAGSGLLGVGGGLQMYNQTMSYLNMMYDQLQPIYDFNYNQTSNTARVNGEYILGELLVFKVWTPSALLVSDATTGVSGATRGVAGGVSDVGDPWVDPSVNFTQTTSGTPYAMQGVYNNRWVKNMATAFTKQMNGIILKKFQGMTLPGGIVVDGQGMYNEALDEIDDLRQELNDISPPLGIYYG